MNAFRIITQNIVVASGILLIAGTMLHFEKRVNGWQNYRIVLMAICAIGFISVLIYEYKTGNKKKFWEMIITLALVFIIGLLFYLFA